MKMTKKNNSSTTTETVLKILNKFLPLELSSMIQSFNLKKKEFYKPIYENVINNVNEIIKDKFDNLAVHKHYNINLQNLTFYKFYKLSINQNYHAKQSIKTIGKLRAYSIVNNIPSRNLIYSKEAIIIHKFLHYVKTNSPPLTFENVKLITKLDKHFLSYSREELCNAVIKKSKKNYHMCRCKKIIKNNKISYFCKRHINKDMKENILLIQENLLYIENYKIKSKHPRGVDNYQIEYKDIKKYL